MMNPDGGQPLFLFPESVHVIGQVGEGKEERDDEQHFAFAPTHGLLMPETRQDRENGEYDANHVERELTAMTLFSQFQFAMLDAIDRIDVQSDEHPQD